MGFCLPQVELLVAEAQEAFGGEDPRVPELRHTPDHTKERLADLHASLLAYVEPFELPEPDKDEVGEVRALYASGCEWRRRGDLPLPVLPGAHRGAEGQGAIVLARGSPGIAYSLACSRGRDSRLKCREGTSARQFSFADRGAAVFRGLEVPVRLYEVAWQQAAPVLKPGS